MTDSVPPRVNAWYPTRGALLSNARAEGPRLTLFVPTSTAASVPLDAVVVLELTLGDAQMRAQLEGRAVSHVQALGTRREGGLIVAFEGPHKTAAARLLATCAGRSADTGTAMDPRFTVEIGCLVVNAKGKRVKATVRDLSNSGAFIKVGSPAGLRREAELNVQLDPILGLFGGTTLRARVMWVGEKNGQQGIGVRFVEERARVRENLKKHLPDPKR